MLKSMPLCQLNLHPTQACGQPSASSSRLTDFYELDINIRGFPSLAASLVSCSGRRLQLCMLMRYPSHYVLASLYMCYMWLSYQPKVACVMNAFLHINEPCVNVSCCRRMMWAVTCGVHLGCTPCTSTSCNSHVLPATV